MLHCEGRNPKIICRYWLPFESKLPVNQTVMRGGTQIELQHLYFSNAQEGLKQRFVLLSPGSVKKSCPKFSNGYNADEDRFCIIQHLKIGDFANRKVTVTIGVN